MPPEMLTSPESKRQQRDRTSLRRPLALAVAALVVVAVLGAVLRRRNRRSKLEPPF